MTLNNLITRLHQLQNLGHGGLPVCVAAVVLASDDDILPDEIQTPPTLQRGKHTVPNKEKPGEVSIRHGAFIDIGA